MDAIFFHKSRSIPDETTETQPLTSLQGEGGFGSLERREDYRVACCALERAREPDDRLQDAAVVDYPSACQLSQNRCPAGTSDPLLHSDSYVPFS
jgi:hypothetical protein